MVALGESVEHTGEASWPETPVGVRERQKVSLVGVAHREVQSRCEQRRQVLPRGPAVEALGQLVEKGGGQRLRIAQRSLDLRDQARRPLVAEIRPVEKGGHAEQREARIRDKHVLDVVEPGC